MGSDEGVGTATTAPGTLAFDSQTCGTARRSSSGTATPRPPSWLTITVASSAASSRRPERGLIRAVL